MTFVDPDPSRRIILAGPLNFRDLGGYSTGEGGKVRWRRLFRSDGLWRTSPDDVATLAEQLGLSTIVDLRGDTELERYGRGPLESHPIEYHRVPLIDPVLLSTEPGGFPSMTMLELYVQTVESGPATVARALTLVAEAVDRPTVFHCAAGKDRTGILAALILGLVGVAEDDIVADYALTEEILPTMVARYRAMAKAQGVALDEEGIARSMVAHPEIMRGFLDHLDDGYGGIVGFARHAGVTDATIALLKHHLVEPA